MEISLDRMTNEDVVKDVLNLNDDDKINFDVVKNNFKDILGAGCYETFFKITTVPEPKDLNSFLVLANNIVWNTVDDPRNPFIGKGVSVFNTEPTEKIAADNPFLMDYVRDLYKQKDHYVVKQMREAGIKASEMTNDYEPYQTEAYFAFIEHVGDKIRNMSTSEVFNNALEHTNVHTKENNQSVNKTHKHGRSL